MAYKTVKYSNREEAAEALHKMIERKREWVEKQSKNLKNLPN